MITAIFGAVLVMCAIIVAYALVVSLKHPSAEPDRRDVAVRQSGPQTDQALIGEAAMKLLQERTLILERRQALVSTSLREQRLIIDMVTESISAPISNDEPAQSI